MQVSIIATRRTYSIVDGFQKSAQCTVTIESVKFSDGTVRQQLIRNECCGDRRATELQNLAQFAAEGKYGTKEIARAK